MKQLGIVKKVFGRLVGLGVFNQLSDESFLKLSFRVNMGRRLNLDTPTTFNEKLQWLKLHDRQPEYVKYVDKYEVREYIRREFGEELLIPIYGIWDSAEDLRPEALPDQFVLKCTHDSGSVCICQDKTKFDFDAAKKHLAYCLKHNLFYWGREWPYKHVRPRIIAEKLMSNDSNEDVLTDYKLMCFNGQVRCSFTGTDRFSNDGLKITFFDRDWVRMPFERHYPSDKRPIEKPKTYERMVEIAEVISKGHPFMRVDFYEIAGQLYFGEITLYPGNGMEEFAPEYWDNQLGSWINLGERGE